MNKASFISLGVDAEVLLARLARFCEVADPFRRSGVRRRNVFAVAGQRALQLGVGPEHVRTRAAKIRRLPEVTRKRSHVVRQRAWKCRSRPEYHRVRAGLNKLFSGAFRA